MSVQFEDQGMVVVEGTSGVGRAVVLLAAERGAALLFTGAPGSEEAAAEVLAACEAAGAAGRASYLAADLAQPSEVERLFDAAFDRLPALNVLVVNDVETQAAFAGRSLADTSPAEWEECLSRCLRRPFLITQRTVDEFLGGGEGGRIVFLLSNAAAGGTEGGITSLQNPKSKIQNSPGCLAAAQTALHSFVRSVTKEYGRRKIACNAIVVHQEAGNEMTAAGARRAAETVLFLASSEASYVNGEVVEVE